MKKLLIFFLFCPSMIFGNYIIHDKIHEAPHNIPCSIEAFLNTTEDIHRFSLLYRPKGNLDYFEAPMILIGHLKYRTEIPANFMVRDQIEYYLLLELSYEKNVTYPEQDAINNPIIIQIDLPTEEIISIPSSERNLFDIEGLYPEVVIINPQPGERVKAKNLFIALSYFGEKNVDPKKVRVYLDDLDVSERAEIDSTYLTISSASLTPGIHTVTINITNNLDQKYNDVSWSFTVVPRNVTGVGLIRKQSGNMWANYTGGSVNNPVINIGEFNLLYEIDLDLLQCIAKYTKSSLENKYDQPRDRYVLDLITKDMYIKFGDSYPSLDKYALTGHHMRGVNFNFNRGLFSIDILQGNTMRAIQGDPSNGAMVFTEIDSSTNNWIISMSRDNYIFQQELLAVKMDFQVEDKFYLDVNYIKVEDNIATVAREITDAKIMITTNDSIFSIRYDSLLDNFTDIFGENDSINFPNKHWIGTKPRDNLIYGSNMKLAFDDSRIQMSSGFSLSFLNRNTWNNLESISELDTFSVDNTLDGLFLDSLQLDTTLNLSQYENYFNFGINQQPMVPFMLQKNSFDIIDILNMPNLNRYIKLQLRYLGHRIELGSRRNGPEYYSILNPHLTTNFTESYISDRSNLFENKLLLYYKKSKIIEGLYSEQISPIEIHRSTFNISLFPGNELPTFNFGFTSSNRTNNEDKIIDQVTYFSPDSTEADTITFIRREETINNLFNISMTNQFNLLGDQVLSVNMLLFDQKDEVAKNIHKDTLITIGYHPKDATSESYGISLKSIYNNYWESTLYLNASYYDYGWSGIADHQIQNFRNLQLNLTYHPIRYITKLNFGLNYSFSRGMSSQTKYNFIIGAESEFLKNFIISVKFDHRIKFNNNETKGTSDSFIQAYLSYNII